MRLHLCVVSVLTSVACGGPQLESARGVQPRAAVDVAGAAAGSSAECAGCSSAQPAAVPSSARRTPDARAATPREGE